MIYFDSDYMAGAHPEVMERLMETNFEQTTGYGSDAYTANAAGLIRKACDAPHARVHFLVGGTQTNATVIDGILARHEGVLAAESGHINVHESGAVEATGHKVLTLPSHQGKVSALQHYGCEQMHCKPPPELRKCHFQMQFALNHISAFHTGERPRQHRGYRWNNNRDTCHPGSRPDRSQRILLPLKHTELCFFLHHTTKCLNESPTPQFSRFP